MALEVLQARSEIIEGRRALRARGVSSLAPAWKEWLARYGLAIKVGDDLKSWDVRKTAEFIEARVPRDAPILDIGAFASEIPPLLHRLGYRRIAAIDLNPGIGRMPFAGTIDYRVGDFLRPPFADGSFAAVSAISVIEHGFDQEALLAMLARMLRPGGYFVGSFDYWPEKIDTAGIRMFDMSWTVFSRADVQRLVERAAAFGLVPCGALAYGAAERPISCAGKDYTFAWLALQRT